LSVSEVQALLAAVGPQYELMVKLLYGSGLRLMELLRLRVKDLDFDTRLIIVRAGPGSPNAPLRTRFVTALRPTCW